MQLGQTTLLSPGELHGRPFRADFSDFPSRTSLCDLYIPIDLNGSLFLSKQMHWLEWRLLAAGTYSYTARRER